MFRVLLQILLWKKFWISGEFKYIWILYRVTLSQASFFEKMHVFLTATSNRSVGINSNTNPSSVVPHTTLQAPSGPWRHLKRRPHSSVSPALLFQSRIRRNCNASLRTTFSHLVLGFPTDLILRNCSYRLSILVRPWALWLYRTAGLVRELRKISVKERKLNCRRKQTIKSRVMPAFCVTKFSWQLLRMDTIKWTL